MKRAKTRAERLVRLEKTLLSHPQGLSKAELAHQLDVDRSTIVRDIIELERLNIPIWQDEKGNVGVDRELYVIMRLEKYGELPQELPTLIKEGEGVYLEFKAAACWNEYRKAKDNKLVENILRTTAGFMNAKGGLLLIGVADNGNIVGLADDYKVANAHKQNQDGYQLFLRDALNNHLGADSISFYEINFHQLESKDVCCIRVKAADKPVYFKGELCVRSGNQTRQLTTREAIDYIKQRWG